MIVGVIIQARQTSSRLPNKVLKKIGKITVIELIIKRLLKSKLFDKIIIAIPQNKKNDLLYKFLFTRKIKVFRGSEKNVLDRYYKAAKFYKINTIIRVTADCPLIDTKLIEKGLNVFKKNKYNFVSNTITRSFPDGLDFSIFSYDLLKKRWLAKNDEKEREHVTVKMKKFSHKKTFNIKNNVDFSRYRWTLDNEIDLKKIKKIYKSFSPNIYFSWKDVLNKGFK